MRPITLALKRKRYTLLTIEQQTTGRRKWRLPSCRIAACVFVWLLFCTPASAQFQRVPNVPGTEDKVPGDDLKNLYSDRQITVQLKEISNAASKRQTKEVRELLNSLRAADPMFMVADSAGLFIPLHRVLTLKLQGFHPEIQSELQKDNEFAEGALARTLASESYSGLITFLHRHAGTRASLKAHLLLAAVHADRGHGMAAEYWLAPVLTGKVDPEVTARAEAIKAKVVSVRKEATRPTSDATSNAPPTSEEETAPTDEKQNTDSPSNASDDLKSSAQVPDEIKATVQSQNSDEPQISESSKPENPEAISGSPETDLAQHVHWTQTLPLPAAMKRYSHDLVQASAELGILPWSAWQPEFDAQRIYIRTPKVISAYSRETGKHEWTRAIQTASIEQEPDDEMMAPFFQMLLNDNAKESALLTPELQLVHRNELVGRMSSDKERLYAVCRIGDEKSQANAETNLRLRVLLGQDTPRAVGHWELLAIEKSTGRRLWTNGGPPVEEKFGNELAMSWFAGPPAVNGTDLYQIVERKATIELVCLNASTGQIRWSLPLAYPESEISLDANRQLLAAQTSVDAGLIFTTTTTGWLFCVDAMTHSVLWTRKLPGLVETLQRSRSFRRDRSDQASEQPLGKIWRSQPPRLFDEVLLIASAETSQIQFLDPRNGKVRYRPAADKATIVLYSDREVVITASTTSIVAFELPKMKKLWTMNRQPASPVPVGSSVRSGNRLLVPLSNGSVDVVSITDGKLQTNLTRLRPPLSSGGLFQAGSDIISFGPGHLSLLSKLPAARFSDDDPVQEASFLLEIGRLQEAAEAVSRVELHALNAEKVRRLRFRIAAGNLATEEASPAKRLEEIAALAKTPAERALSQFLRLDFLVKSSPDTVATDLINALNEDDTMLQVEIPEADSVQKLLQRSSSENPLQSSSFTKSADSLRLPLRSWIYQQLRRRLANSNEQQQNDLVLSLGGLSDSDLLEMQDDELVETYLSRAETHLLNKQWNETVFQLLITAGHLAKIQNAAIPASQPASESSVQIAKRISAAFDQALELVDQQTSDDLARNTITKRMIQVVRYEVQPLAKEIAVDRPEDVRSKLVTRWSSLTENPYLMVPVSSASQLSFRTVEHRPIQTNSHTDLFLSAYHWSIQRDPANIQAQAIHDPSLPVWSQKHTEAGASYMTSDYHVSRFGSILIFNDEQRISAFSVAEQRWLWSRSLKQQSRHHFAARTRPFRDYDRDDDFAVRLGNSTDRVCGGSNLSLCLVSDDKLEVVHLLTGNRQWLKSNAASGNAVSVTNSAVRIDSRKTMEMLVSPIDGSAIQSEKNLELSFLSTRIIRGSEDALVVWHSANEDGDPSIRWIHPISCELIKEVTLPDAEFSQFLDPDTLISLTEHQTFHVLNLITGERQTFDFSDPDSAETRMRSPSSIVFSVDAANYYLYETDDNGMPLMMARLEGIHGETVQKELRAVSRKTGKLAWVNPVDDTLLACIQGTESVMLLVKVSEKPVANALPMIPGLMMQPGQHHAIEGISRITGQKLLEFAVISQMPFRNVRLRGNMFGQLDLEAFGSRMRFFPQESVVAP